MTAQCTDTECENVSRVNKPCGQLGHIKLLSYYSNSADVHHEIILIAATSCRVLDCRNRCSQCERIKIIPLNPCGATLITTNPQDNKHIDSSVSQIPNIMI